MIKFILIYCYDACGEWEKAERYFETEKELLDEVNNLANDKNGHPEFEVLFAAEISKEIKFEPRQVVTEYVIV